MSYLRRARQDRTQSDRRPHQVQEMWQQFHGCPAGVANRASRRWPVQPRAPNGPRESRSKGSRTPPGLSRPRRESPSRPRPRPSPNQSSGFSTPAFVPAGTSPAQPREYKLLTPKDKYFDGKFDLNRLEEALNHFGRQGWVVKAVSTPPHQGILGRPRGDDRRRSRAVTRGEPPSF